MDEEIIPKEQTYYSIPETIEIDPDVLSAMGIDDLSKYMMTVKKTTKEELTAIFNWKSVYIYYDDN